MGFIFKKASHQGRLGAAKRDRDELLRNLFREPKPREAHILHRHSMRRMKPVFGDYTDLIYDACTYTTFTVSTYKDYDGKFSGDGRYHYTILPTFEAIDKLCKINSKISSNVLYLLTKMENLVFEKIYMKDPDGWSQNQTITFTQLVKRAQKEYNRRGSPPYDPSVYFDKKNWRLSENDDGRRKLNSLSDNEKKKRIEDILCIQEQREITFSETVELGKLNLALGKAEVSDKYFRKAIEIEPDNPKARILLIKSLMDFGLPVSKRDNWSEIRIHLDWLRKNNFYSDDTEWIEYFSGIGQMRIDTGNLLRFQDNYIKSCLEVEQKFPSNYLVLFTAGTLLVRILEKMRYAKETDDQLFRIARRILRKSYSANPNFVPTKANLQGLKTIKKSRRKIDSGDSKT